MAARRWLMRNCHAATLRSADAMSGSALLAYLRAPVDQASLVAFRALFGTALAIAAMRFMAKGWVYTQFIAPRFHFSYPGFAFVRPWPGYGMYLHFVALFVAALGLAIGYRPRLCACFCALGWAYVELIDRANYLNHYYLACLMAGLLAFMPAAGTLREHARRRASMPRWLLVVLRWQVACVYVFAGLAKLNGDWLVRAQPLRIWLAARAEVLSIGGIGLGDWLAQPASALIASWLGAFFDLSIVVFLLWPRTRVLAFAVALAFHVTTGWLFPIGMFPWLMLACATLFFDPAWPRRWFQPTAAANGTAFEPRRGCAFVLAVHCALQALIPLHHHLWVRDSAWTCEGFDFAWKVMAVEKAGSVTYRTRDQQSGAETLIEPRRYLNAGQSLALGQDPRLIRALAQQIAHDESARSGHEVAVYADAFATLNGRPVQRLIAPDVDLTRDPLPARWIVALDTRQSY
jgi:vitamin K-dependent gamma-carboxylase